MPNSNHPKTVPFPNDAWEWSADDVRIYRDRMADRGCRVVGPIPAHPYPSLPPESPRKSDEQIRRVIEETKHKCVREVDGSPYFNYLSGVVEALEWILDGTTEDL